MCGVWKTWMGVCGCGYTRECIECESRLMYVCVCVVSKTQSGASGDA